MAKKKPHTGKKLFDSQVAAHAMPEGYYCGDQPNPNLRRFIDEYATPYDAETDGYKVAAFNQPISTSKATAIYNMHRYDSKKPHDAIRHYVRHYTQVGDIVLDPFSGSGGTCLAASMEGRRAVGIDRSPAAAFITKSYCTPVDAEQLHRFFEEVKQKVHAELAWLYPKLVVTDAMESNDRLHSLQPSF